MSPLIKKTVAFPLNARLGNALSGKKPIVAAYLLVAAGLFIQLATSGRYNNFIIFRQSWRHLAASLPLYIHYPAEYFDLFLYHPSFPVFFAPFALLPEVPALFAWLLLSVALFLYAIHNLPLEDRTRSILAWFLLLELGNALQSAQTNPAMTAFMLLTVVHLQREEPGKAALYTCLAFFIKGYGAIAGLLFLFFPKKQQYLGYCLLYGAIGTLLPLLFVQPETLIQYYTTWFQLLTNGSMREEVSLAGIFHLVTGGVKYDTVLFLAGCLLLAGIYITALVRRGPSTPWLVLGALMIWIVVFNQSAESPTYIIAVTGVGMALLQPPRHRQTTALLFLTLVVTCLAPTDLVPKFLNNIAVTYRVKALPCTLVLLFIQWRLMTDTNEIKHLQQSTAL